MLAIPGTWQQVLIVTLLIVILLGLACLRLARWRRSAAARRNRRQYARHRTPPDERDSLALFRRLNRARVGL